MKTKEKIVYEALTLFSMQGYNAVSVRDISRAVGIKESSLYNHFKNKQDIFDGVVEVCYEKATTFYEAMQIPYTIGDSKIDMYQGISNELLMQITFKIFEYYFCDEYAVKFRRMLIIEQFNNKRIQELYRKLYMEDVIHFQSSIFKYLISKGEFRSVDPEYIAIAFYSPIFLMLNQYDEFDEEVKQKLKRHVLEFKEAFKPE